jgi:predicted NBD/HSP70 family sugar kinase
MTIPGREHPIRCVHHPLSAIVRPAFHHDASIHDRQQKNIYLDLITFSIIIIAIMNASNKTQARGLLSKETALQYIWFHDGAHRQQMVKKFGCRPNRVTDLIAELIRDRWIDEGEPQRSGTGRSPVPLHISRKSKAALAASYTHGLQLALINVAGEILRESISQEVPTDPRELTKAIARETRNLTAGFTGNIIGIGVADPGMIDTTRREVLKSSTFPSWQNVPLARLVQASTGLPVLLEDSSRLAAMAQYRALPELAASGASMLGLDFGMNLGFSLITPTGAFCGSGFAGGLSHVTMDPHGPPCECGRRGCLEAMAGGRPLIAQARALLKTRTGSIQRKGGAITPDLVLEAAAGGDSVAQESVASILPHLRLAVSLAIAAYHPRLIVIGAGTDDAAAYLAKQLKTTLSGHLLPEIARTIEIRAGGETRALVLRGAGLMVFNDLVMNNGARLFRA